MATLEQRTHARSFLRKAEEYLASAEANLTAERYTVAAGDAIHAGICAKDSIVTELTGTTPEGQGPRTRRERAEAGAGAAAGRRQRGEGHARTGLKQGRR
jgi:hypothetical protein